MPIPKAISVQGLQATTSRKRRPRAGFTVVELLTALGIVTVLVSILLPTLSRVRESSRRTTDLSNLGQLSAACIAYANANDGLFPIGRMSGAPPLADDYTWISYRDCWNPLLGIVPNLKNMNSCYSVKDVYGDADDFGSPESDYGYPKDTKVGWIYWGGRDDLIVNGQLQYRSLHRLGQRLTPGSQTLWTCWCWDSAGNGGPSICPHVGAAGVIYPNGVALKPPPDGLGVALDDGSASFVPWPELIIIPQANGFKLYYQP